MGLVESAFEFLGDTLHRQIMNHRLAILDHADVMLQHYPDLPQIIQPTEVAAQPLQPAPAPEELDLATITPIRPEVVGEELDKEQIRNEVNDSYGVAA